MVPAGKKIAHAVLHFPEGAIEFERSKNGNYHFWEHGLDSGKKPSMFVYESTFLGYFEKAVCNGYKIEFNCEVES